MRHGREPSTGASVAVATCREVPDLDADGPPLLAALRRAGLRPEIRVWDDTAVDWSSYRVVLVRSTWDYYRRRGDFVEWARRCPRTANPAGVLDWNTDKRYLLDLERAGVPVVPSTFSAPGEPLVVPAAWSAGEIVVKPAVSGAAADTGRFGVASPAARELAGRIHAQGRTVMVQPYLPHVEAQGETSVVFLAGRFSHAFRKAALLADAGTRAPLVGDAALEAVTATTATGEQLALARRAVAVSPGGLDALSYARVDLIPDAEGRPVVLELELTEPSLFLRFGPVGAADALAADVAARASGRPR